MRKAKFILLAALVGLIVVCAVIFAGGGRLGYDPARLVGSMPDDVDMRLSGVNYSEVTEGERDWTLKADTLRSFKGSRTMVFEDVTLTFFTGDGTVRMTGEEALYDKAARKVRLVGRVRAEDAKGNVLTTKEIRYDVMTAEALAPGQFQIDGPTFSLNGKGLRIFMKDGKVQVLQQTELTIKTPGSLL